MALNSNTLKSIILNNLEAEEFDISRTAKDEKNWIHLFVRALSQAIVQHIQDGAVVKTTTGAPDAEHTGHIL
ncbi:hypothetical protein GMMP15_840007 [Candidatus Magnetomoraceae bacterium gMMP-15]